MECKFILGTGIRIIIPKSVFLRTASFELLYLSPAYTEKKSQIDIATLICLSIKN